jgi:hypothetical protein
MEIELIPASRVPFARLAEGPFTDKYGIELNTKKATDEGGHF